MPDDIDRDQEFEQKILDAQIAEQRKLADIPAGSAGECDICGEFTTRRVRGACAPCRDKYKLG